MPESKLENNMQIVQQNWNKFISLLKKDLKDLYKRQRELNVLIKKYSTLKDILEKSKDNIDIIFNCKNIILSIDPSLKRTFEVLEAFKNMTNLNNAVAIRTYNEILHSTDINNAIDLLDQLENNKEVLDREIEKVQDIIQGAAYDKETILRYCDELGIGIEEQTTILMYPIIKSARKLVPSYRKRDKVGDSNKSSDDVPTESKEPEQIDTVVHDTINLDKTSEANDKEQFEKLKDEYESIKSENNQLFSKYYEILNSMKPDEKDSYKVYSTLPLDALSNILFEHEYDEAMAKVIAIKLFDKKEEIENFLKSLSDEGNINYKDAAELLKMPLDEFKPIVDRLKALDKKIETSKKGEEITTPSRVYFLTDDNNIPLIPELFRDGEYHGSLLNVIKKAQEGFVQSKRGCDVRELKPSAFLKREYGRTVFMLTSNGIAVSYVKLNSTNGAIAIITASLLRPNTIGEDTKRIIKDYKELILSQLEELENGNEKQIENQNKIMEAIINNRPIEALEGGMKNG